MAGDPPDLSHLTIERREALTLAPYAMHSIASAGRVHDEADHPYRGPFQRDRDRIVHSAAYRRLSHKTQVFTDAMGDYHRTRLTHTLEVASIARTIARALGLNEDLVEALALAHDIGHPPFGHAGEDILNECLASVGGFNHNAQALRIFERLESRYGAFPGLNLCRETLEGQRSRIDKAEAAHRLLEVQVVDAADSVAYDTHDADDALESGLIEFDELLNVPLWTTALQRIRDRHRDAPSTQSVAERLQLRRALLHELIDWQVGDLVATTRSRLIASQVNSAAEARSAGPLVEPSEPLASLKSELETYLFDQVYRHPRVVAERSVAQQRLQRMYQHYCKTLNALPEKFRLVAEQEGPQRAVADYLAGMTDRFADLQFRRIFER